LVAASIGSRLLVLLPACVSFADVEIGRVEREEVDVLFVRAVGAAGEVAPLCWERLEAALSSLRGRTFYGVFDPARLEYRACVERQDDDDPLALGLEPGTVAGGAYLRTRVRGEPPAVYDRIGPVFEQLGAAAEWDATRPYVEHYRRRDEIDLLLPVRAE
jgi:hypothetical protein